MPLPPVVFARIILWGMAIAASALSAGLAIARNREDKPAEEKRDSDAPPAGS